MNRAKECKVIKIEENTKVSSKEFLVYEYPLTIHLNNKKIAILLCSPENLKELVIGFLRTEKYITCLEDIIDFSLDIKNGVAEIRLETNIQPTYKSFCEEFILESIEDIDLSFYRFLNKENFVSVNSNIFLSYTQVYELMERNLSYSELYRKTGAVHSISLCDVNGIVIICEDVARHNALDKVIGKAILEGISFEDKILVVSGRVSLQMILKAAVMMIPIIISKSAPTSLSVALATKLNITLVGFVRNKKMIIYANEERIKF